MAFKRKSLAPITAILILPSLLNGCITTALAPAAISIVAETFSVHATGQTISENIKDAVLESKKPTEKPAAEEPVALN